MSLDASGFVFEVGKMTDLATLAIKVTTSGADKSARDLNNVERAAKKTETATEQLNKCFGRLQALLALSGIGGGISQVLALADKMQSLRNQVQFVTSSMTEMNQVQKELFDISQRTRASLEATTSLYTRSAQALKDYGYASKDILQFTETMNKAMAVGGVSAEAQASALFQLSQALGSGQLQGDEFKTIAESAPIILDVLAEYMGKSRAEVKKLASEGKLTSKLIFDAFNGSTEKINQKFEQMPISFGGAMQQMENAFMKFVDEQNRTLGITENLAAGVSFLAQNFEYLAGVLLAITAGNGAKFISTLVLARVETHRQAQASLIAAKATQTQAAAELAAAQAKMNLLNSEMQLVRTKKARAAIEAKMAQQAQVITGLANAEAAAMNNLAAASQRASIASRASAGAKSLLSGALGLIGGPMGAATIAAGALFYFYEKSQEAKAAALDTAGANDRLKQSYAELSQTALTETLRKQIDIMANYKAQISDLRGEIETTKQVYQSTTGFIPENVLKNLDEMNDKLKQMQENQDVDLSAFKKQIHSLAASFIAGGKSINDFKNKMNIMGVEADVVNEVLSSNEFQLSAIKAQLQALFPKIDATKINYDGLNITIGNFSIAADVATVKALNLSGAIGSIMQTTLMAAGAVANLNGVLGGGMSDKMQATFASLKSQQKVLALLKQGNKLDAYKEEARQELLASGFKEGEAGFEDYVNQKAQLKFDQENYRSSKVGHKKVGHKKVGKSAKEKSSEDYRNEWDKYYDDLVNANATAWEKIQYEQDVAKRELEKHLSHGIVKQQEAEKARTLIAEQYAKQRRELAGQYAPEIAFQDKLKAQLKDIQQLEQGGALTAEQAAQARQNLGAKYSPLIAAMEEYRNKLAEIDALEKARILTTEQANVAKADAEYEKWKATADKKDPMNGIRQGWEEWAKSAGNTMEQVASITGRAFDGMADQLTNFVMTGKADFRSFTVSILSDISKMIIKMMILNAIKSAFGGFAGGGLVGGTQVDSSAIYGMGTWATGGFTGYGGKYEPAGIVHKGEYVITKEATARLGRGFLDQLNYGKGYSTGGMVGLPSTFGNVMPAIPVGNPEPSQNNTITINVTVDSNGNTESDTQLDAQDGKRLGKMIEQKVLEVIIQQKRKGNLLA